MNARRSLRLRPLGPEDEAQAMAAHRELAQEGFDFLLQWRPDEDGWSAWLAKVARIRAGPREPELVAAIFLGAFVGDELVGRTSIRLTLNDFLRERGGHIGYGVRPAHRRQGYATEILGQSLVILRAEGVGRALVTCDHGNLASARTIEHHHGVLEDVREFGDGTRIRRYWID